MESIEDSSITLMTKDRLEALIATVNHIWKKIKEKDINLELMEKENIFKYCGIMTAMMKNELSMVDKDIYATYLCRSRPDMPDARPSVFYYSHTDVNIHGIKHKDCEQEAEDAFSRLDDKAKFEWYERQIKAFEEFQEAEQKWKMELNILDRYIYEAWFKRQFQEKKTLQPRSRQKIYEVVERSVPSYAISFNIKYPPLTPSALYAAIHKVEGDKFIARGMYGALSPLMRDVYNKIVHDIRRQFINEILAYVKSLGDHEKKLYIGLRRKVLIKHLGGEDIFEELYPDNLYPVIKPVKITSKRRKADNRDATVHYREDSDEGVEEMPPDFDPYIAIKKSISQLQLLVDYNLDTDSD